MSGQGVVVWMLVLAAVAYLAWRLARRAKPVPGRGGCGCCHAVCAARGLSSASGNTACPEKPSRDRSRVRDRNRDRNP